ncbi:hypothetical protein SERLADRAFT_404633 [Serpula lacrymans var. lacrymans S7.9]|uniref:Uncharacterized protein n=1 Tax=Serpula lacrymans var. lacrymans (strain S7.9) TaxID=578457 RepID=F8NEA4_SERL9|nr:uncharacterized protein SERLADRAFT_404633 [Serpula lacrymans var. lacrymans S7.9]EGO30486.1 hypothetical protein SERLADRAFT_404633 [Serpula lacrymans var. lacrymans S7.9]
MMGEEEMDLQLKAMASYPRLQHFKKGISRISQWTGSEHKETERVFVGLLAGGFDAQFQIHMTKTLTKLNECLEVFYASKDVFKDLDIRSDFNIPKLHTLLHYVKLIKLFGAANGFNAELPKCPYIDYAKEAYQSRAIWLQHQDAINLQGFFLLWQIANSALLGSEGLKTVGVESDMTDSEVEELGLNCTPVGRLTPSAIDHFDVYKQVAFVVPPNLQTSKMGQCLQLHCSPGSIVSQTSRKGASPTYFNMALVIKNREEFEGGLSLALVHIWLVSVDTYGHGHRSYIRLQYEQRLEMLICPDYNSVKKW